MKTKIENHFVFIVGDDARYIGQIEGRLHLRKGEESYAAKTVELLVEKVASDTEYDAEYLSGLIDAHGEMLDSADDFGDDRSVRKGDKKNAEVEPVEDDPVILSLVERAEAAAIRAETAADRAEATTTGVSADNDKDAERKDTAKPAANKKP